MTRNNEGDNYRWKRKALLESKKGRTHYIIFIMESTKANHNILHCARVHRTGFLGKRLQIKKKKQCDRKNGKNNTERES